MLRAFAASGAQVGELIQSLKRLARERRGAGASFDREGLAYLVEDSHGPRVDGGRAPLTVGGDFV